MKREEFTSLPVGIALGILYDQMPGRLEHMAVPKSPMSPKYDQIIRRKNGYQWASETDLESLRFFLTLAQRPPTDEKYREKNEKNAKALSYWVAWREAEPRAVWTGERNRVPATAKPPTSKPEQHEWEARGNAPAAGDSSGAAEYGFAGGSGGGGFDDQDYGGGSKETDDIPYRKRGGPGGTKTVFQV